MDHKVTMHTHRETGMGKQDTTIFKEQFKNQGQKLNKSLELRKAWGRNILFKEQ